MKLVSCGKSISMQRVCHTIVREEQELKLQNFMWQKLFQTFMKCYTLNTYGKILASFPGLPNVCF